MPLLITKVINVIDTGNGTSVRYGEPGFNEVEITYIPNQTPATADLIRDLIDSLINHIGLDHVVQRHL